MASSLPLARTSVLITRPVGQGRALARRVRALGGEPVLLPGLSLRAIKPTPALRSALKQALAGDMVLFSSPSAVRFAARLAPLVGAARIGAVGGGTARALSRHGVAQVIMPQTTHDSAGLLAHPALARVHGLRITVVGAPGGRGALQRRLRERGAEVDEVHVYERVPARLDARHRRALHHLRATRFLLLSSVQTLQHLHAALAGEDWRIVSAGTAVVSSERVAAAARASGFVRVVQADSALASALLARTVELAVHGS